MPNPNDCPHPDDARTVTGKGIEKCSACGVYNPAADLNDRLLRADAAVGRVVRELRPDLYHNLTTLATILVHQMALAHDEKADESPRRRPTSPRSRKEE